MANTKPTPWNFSNSDKIMKSANNGFKIVYYDLNEIAMGAPIGGEAFLETSSGDKVKIHEWCGGPPVWNAEGNLLAIPIWLRSAAKGIVQQIGVVDTKRMELQLFSRTFGVLDLRSFDKGIVQGYNSPIYMPTEVVFDLHRESKANVIKLAGS